MTAAGVIAAVVAVDIGSSAVRAISFAEDLTVEYAAERPLKTLTDDTGRSAHRWEQLLSNTVAVIAETVSNSSRVGAVVLSGTASCLVAASADRTTVSDVLLWSDARSRQHSQAALPVQAAAYERTLCPAHISYWPAKLLWLNQTYPAAQLAFAGAKDLVFEHLTGQLWTDPMSAAATGMFDSDQWAWDAELLEVAGVRRAQLPTVQDATEHAPLLSAPAARLGLSAGTPVVVGGMDGPLSQLGSAGFATDAASCTVGTSLAFRTATAVRRPDPEQRLWCYPVTADLWVLGGAGSNGGNVVGYFADLVGGTVEASLAIALGTPSDARLHVLPYVWGERSPLWRDDLRGALVGLSPNHTSADVLRAALDGVATLLLELASAVLGLTGSPRQVYLTGGFLRSSAWAQLMTDALGLPTCLPRPKEATAAGAAALAWAGIGVAPLPISARPAEDLRYPNPDVHANIAARASRGQRIRDALYGGPLNPCPRG